MCQCPIGQTSIRFGFEKQSEANPVLQRKVLVVQGPDDQRWVHSRHGSRVDGSCWARVQAGCGPKGQTLDVRSCESLFELVWADVYYRTWISLHHIVFGRKIKNL